MTNQPEMNRERIPSALTDAARRAYLASLGLFAMAQDEVEQLLQNAGSFTDKLVERGEKLEEQNRERVDKVVEQRREQVKERADKAEDRLANASGDVLSRFNVPTAKDIEDLNKKVASLNRKVDRLRKEKEQAAAAKE
jgi:poly(hydroxyalkanoate) granule-associated protein